MVDAIKKGLTNMKRRSHLRELTDEFADAFVDGPLNPLLELIRRDRDLNAEIRDECVDIYCKGNRLVRITRARNGFNLVSDEKFWSKKRVRVTDRGDVLRFCDEDVPYVKQKIAVHTDQGMEIEFEQILIRACNIERLNADYICLDRQVTFGNQRADIAGVFWPAKERRRSVPLVPALIEVKYGLAGGVEGIGQQVTDYFTSIRTNMNEFVSGLRAQLRLKARLGLLAGLSGDAQRKIVDLPISEDPNDLRIVLALIDYNPRAKRLSKAELSRLPFAAQIDLYYLGFALWAENKVSLHG